MNAMLAISAIINLLLIIALPLLWLYGRKNGVEYAKTKYQEFYRLRYRDEIDPDSSSYKVGLQDGQILEQSQRQKAIYGGSENPTENLTNQEIGRLANDRK